jgi:putative endopeptidase
VSVALPVAVDTATGVAVGSVTGPTRRPFTPRKLADPTADAPAMHPALLAAAVALAAVASPADAQNRPTRATAPNPPAACADFYGHINHAWQRAHPASATQPERSRLADLQTLGASRAEALLRDAATAPASGLEATLGTFWAAGADLPALDANSARAVQDALAPLAPLRRPRDLPRVLAGLQLAGLATVVEFVRLDAVDGPGRALAAVPVPLGLDDPAFYTATDPELRTLLGQYRTYVEAVLRASGLPEAEVSPASEAVLQIETRLAQALAGEAAGTRSADTLRAQDRRYVALGFADLLERLDAESDRLVVVSPAYFAALSQIATERDVQRLRWYLRFRVLHRLAPDLGAPFRDAHQAFFARSLRGLPATAERSEHLHALLRRNLPGMFDAAYNARHAPEARRARAAAVLTAVREAALASVGDDPAAIDALRAVRFDIAGSDTPAFDGAGLEFRAGDHAGNLRRLWRWREARVIADRPLTIDPLPARLPAVQWLPERRTLAVSAAALAPPLLGEGGANPEPRDFGALGALAGHELSKALDAGSRGAALAALYAGKQAAPHLRVDGARTLPMNRADLAGLEFAWAAFQKAQPQADTPAKRAFFSGWAELWAKTQTAESLRAEVQTSPYAPNALRVNVPLSQLPAFGEAYGCRVGSTMRSSNPIAVWR